MHEDKYLHILTGSECRCLYEALKDSMALRQQLADKIEPRYWDETTESATARERFKQYELLQKQEKVAEAQ